jgi:hypothetical protein
MGPSEHRENARTDGQDVEAELERLREENARLVEQASGAHAIRSGRARRGGAISLVMVGSLLAALSIPAVWVNRTLINTDTWVQTVAPLADEPAIQDAVATAASDAVLEGIDVRSLVAKYLPKEARPLAAPITGAVEDLVRKESTAFSRSELFRKAWTDANRAGHAAVLAAITQREGAVLSDRGGVVSIQLGPMAEAIKKRLVENGLDAANALPTSSIKRELVLFSSPALAQAGSYVDLLQRLAFWIPVLALLAFAGALALSYDRRRATLWIGAGTLIATMLPLQAVYISKVPIVGAVQQLGSSQGAAASVAYDIIFRNLYAAERAVGLVAILLIVGAVLAGPAAFSVTVRSALGGGLSTMSTHFSFGVFGEFVAANKKGLRTGGLLVAAATTLVPAQGVRTLGFIVGVALALIVWLAAVEFFGGGSPAAVDPHDEVAAASEDVR